MGGKKPQNLSNSCICRCQSTKTFCLYGTSLLFTWFFANPNGYVLVWVELFATWSKRDGWGSTCFGSLKSCCFCAASKKIVNRQKVICLFLRVKRKTCEEDLAGEPCKGGFSLFIEMKPSGTPQGKIPGFWFFLPFLPPCHWTQQLEEYQFLFLIGATTCSYCWTKCSWLSLVWTGSPSGKGGRRVKKGTGGGPFQPCAHVRGTHRG